MEAKIIKVTNKGQISIPVSMRESMNIEKGDKLIVAKEKNVIIIRKIEDHDFSDLLKLSERVAKKLWDNKEDEIWDTV